MVLGEPGYASKKEGKWKESSLLGLDGEKGFLPGPLGEELGQHAPGTDLGDERRDPGQALQWRLKSAESGLRTGTPAS
jgi:hypothetical protein